MRVNFKKRQFKENVVNKRNNKNTYNKGEMRSALKNIKRGNK